MRIKFLFKPFLLWALFAFTLPLCGQIFLQPGRAHTEQFCLVNAQTGQAAQVPYVEIDAIWTRIVGSAWHIHEHTSDQTTYAVLPIFSSNNSYHAAFITNGSGCGPIVRSYMPVVAGHYTLTLSAPPPYAGSQYDFYITINPVGATTCAYNSYVNPQRNTISSDAGHNNLHLYGLCYGPSLFSIASPLDQIAAASSYYANFVASGKATDTVQPPVLNVIRIGLPDGGLLDTDPDWAPYFFQTRPGEEHQYGKEVDITSPSTTYSQALANLAFSFQGCYLGEIDPDNGDVLIGNDLVTYWYSTTYMHFACGPQTIIPCKLLPNLCKN